MKVDRHGKAAALSAAQFEALLTAAPSPRYRALWTLQRYMAARISEALALTWGDVVGQQVTFRRATTKTRTTRQLPQNQVLQEELTNYRQYWTDRHGRAPSPKDVLFPSPGSTTSPITRRSADEMLRKTCRQIGLVGVTTHSFRRTAAQDAVNRGVPLHLVQKFTGHKSLGSLGEYLDASDAELLAVIG
ncbi:site-specific integrase [cyanobiont of Ornithocercus magnificus]|nr:site-specific integrase [cyanobiont of Ornithocercus magnificus]